MRFLTKCLVTPKPPFLVFVWILCVLTLVSGRILKAGRPVVDVGNGTVIGVEEVRNNFTYHAFRAIPYAQPPVGTLRFKDPVPSAGWEGDLDGDTLPRNCTQMGDTSSGEDCLYLSIYTPQDALDPHKEPLAVLVFIHGGAFVSGGMNEPDRCHALVEKDIIVVVLQYRLGVLGFMSTEDASAPGNLGLKDQTLALKWIKDNIASFGGDPEKITICGESAGSYSVHYQVLAPSAAGLFRGAILQSGTALCPRAHGRNFLQNARDIAALFECPISHSDELVACLQMVPAELLTDMNNYFEEWFGHPLDFAPRVDGSYIPDEPLTLLKQGQYNHVPLIVGTTRDEGAVFSADWYANPEIIESIQSNFQVTGPNSLELLPDEDPVLTATILYDYYLPGLVLDKEQADNATKLNSHRYFQIPTDWSIELMAPEVSIYMYEVQHRGEHGHMDSYLQNGLDLPQAAYWISHADEMQYLFEWSEWGPLVTVEDLQVREIITTTWANFAKTLNPTPDGSLGWQWNQTQPGNLRYFAILPTPVMQEDYRSSDRELWNSLPLRENPYN